MRIAGDGEPYTFSEFQAYYREAAEDMWQRATHVTATEHDMPPTLLLQSIPAPCGSYYAHLAAANPAHIPEHTDVNATERDLPPPSTHVVDMQAANSTTQPAATEHNFPELRLSRVVSLSLHDAATLRAAEAAIRPKRSLHKLAREALRGSPSRSTGRGTESPYQAILRIKRELSVGQNQIRHIVIDMESTRMQSRSTIPERIYRAQVDSLRQGTEELQQEMGRLLTRAEGLQQDMKDTRSSAEELQRTLETLKYRAGRWQIDTTNAVIPDQGDVCSALSHDLVLSNCHLAVKMHMPTFPCLNTPQTALALERLLLRLRCSYLYCSPNIA